jgi:hypothetical protein
MESAPCSSDRRQGGNLVQRKTTPIIEYFLIIQPPHVVSIASLIPIATLLSIASLIPIATLFCYHLPACRNHLSSQHGSLTTRVKLHLFRQDLQDYQDFFLPGMAISCPSS